MAVLIDIPPSRLVSCCYCADRLDSHAVGTYQRACGWLPVKSKSNRILAVPKTRFIFACETCVGKLKAGVNLGQLSLLSEGNDIDEKY